jgi:hypothetical protein
LRLCTGFEQYDDSELERTGKKVLSQNFAGETEENQSVRIAGQDLNLGGT